MNQCGRTELKGNVDVGENTENALSANAVTQVEPGGEVTVTLHQVNADGAGPFFCDIDQTSNTGVGIQVSYPLPNVYPRRNKLMRLPESDRGRQRAGHQWLVPGQDAGI